MEGVKIYTDYHRIILGTAKELPPQPIVMLWAGRISVPVDKNYLHVVESREEFELIKVNIKNNIENDLTLVKEKKERINLLIKEIADLKKLKLLTSSYTIDHYIEELDRVKTEDEIVWPSLSDAVIKDAKIVMPHSTEPFMYNSDEDLTQFNTGDLLKVKFGGGSKVAKKYKNQELTFVVNNTLDYNWCKALRKLALTPNVEGWRKSQILLVDASYRFDCLMIDLFPCNRRPFAGWGTKTIVISKVGTVSSLPKPKSDTLSLEDLRNKKYHTTMDRKIAIDKINFNINQIREAIKYAEERIERNKGILSETEIFKLENLL